MRELRDLARGIAPPVLADRGLVAAAESLASRSTANVEVVGHLDHRPPPVVETAAYFVVAESLTNVVKHAPGASARVTLSLDGAMLVVEIADNGPGGANPAGSGLTDSSSVSRRSTAGSRCRAWPVRGQSYGQCCHASSRRRGPALLREGIVALLAENDIEVVAQAEDGPGLLRIIDGHKPDLAICDVRLPPTFTDEGIRAALEARRRHPELAILILSPVRGAGLHRRAACRRK